MVICEITTTNWISIVNIVITSAIGIWIGCVVQVNLTTNRALKEYFISEIKIITGDYNSFFNSLYQGSSSSKNVTEWLKIMNIKIETLETTLKNQLKVNPTILEKHIKLKQYITQVEEFNEFFNKAKLMLKVETKNEILELHKNLKQAIVNSIVDINKAHRKKYRNKTLIELRKIL